MRRSVGHGLRKRAAGSLRQEMEDEGYKIDESGYIRSPGKFEAEPYWLPYFYGQMMEGGGSGDFVSDEQGWSVELVELTQEDFDRIPELAEQGFQVGEKIGIEETSQGFVGIMNEPEEGWDAWMEEVNKEMYPEDEDEGGYGKIGMVRLAVKAVYGQFGPDTIPNPIFQGPEAPPRADVRTVQRERLDSAARPESLLRDVGVLSDTPVRPGWGGGQGKATGGRGKAQSAEDLGRRAAKTDGWMFGSEADVREALEESKRGHVRDAGELVEQWKDDWKETDHYRITYLRDLAAMGTGEGEEATYDRMDREDEFWEGVVDGLAKRGVDVYKMAEEIVGETGGRGSADESGEYHCGFAIGVSLDDEYGEKFMVDDETTDLSNELSRVEHNLVVWLQKELGAKARDEGHDSSGDLIGSIWLTAEQVKKVFDQWEFARDGVYFLTSSSGAIGEDAYGDGIPEDVLAAVNVSMELFDLPLEDESG